MLSVLQKLSSFVISALKFWYIFTKGIHMRQDLTTTFTDRQYMLSEDYELYYYQDTHFTPTKPHHHSYYEFYFFIKGDIDFIIHGENHPLEQNDIVIIPPGIKHFAISNDSEKPYQRIVFWISKAYYEYFRNMSSDFNYIFDLAKQENVYVHHPDTITFNSLLTKLLDTIQETKLNHYGKATKINLQIADLLISINRHFYEKAHPSEVVPATNLYNRLIDYIESNITSPITIDELSKIFYTSKSYISHTFKENQGISLHQYIMKRRLQLFRDAVLSGGDIKSTYLNCGFNDYSSFYKAFKKEYGISPNAYRTELVKATMENMKSQQQ